MAVISYETEDIILLESQFFQVFSSSDGFNVQFFVCKAYSGIIVYL